ncbi:MAG: Ribokinase [uncultured Nocardioides sp.]|uniref:Ribokinase n=1 Tax=uncultured Nocardioides sp. TaxID=198441 RepID=A0A6J4MVL4_9ACTN|nr:MAG: Ribokinase [uncultured Nocardioides sp.]
MREDGTGNAGGVVVLGPVSWNEILLVDALPEARPHTVFAEASYETLGGTSAGKALHLTDLGVAVGLRTPVGDDRHGRQVLDALATAGVAPHVLAPAGPTEHHVNVMTASGARLSIYATPPADTTATVTADDLAGARALVLDLAPWTQRLAVELGRRDRDHGPAVWTDLHDTDGSDPWRQPFIDAATHVLCSDDSLADPLGFLHHVVDGGAAVAVCTLGAQGAVAVDADHREWRVSAHPVEQVVDTNGAGDAFFAGVLAATLDGADLPAALDAGARQATRALESRHLSPLLGI